MSPERPTGRWLAPTVALAALALPFGVSPWGLSQLTFVAIYLVAGSGLMLQAGHTGQLSLCHAAFLGVGAYSQALLQQHGWPLPLSLALASLSAAGLGAIILWPLRRLDGVYFAIATLSCGFIAQEVFIRWESLTGGNGGLTLAAVADAHGLYAVCVACALFAWWLPGRLQSSRYGRACRVVRDDALAAAALGVPVAHIKLAAATLAAALGGLAGALYALQIRFVSPEQFDWVMSIELLMMLALGGLGTRAGVAVGALFLIALPQLIGLAAPLLPWAAPPAGLELFAFGLAMLLSLRFAPEGLAPWLRRRYR